MNAPAIKAKYDLIELELNALLEITQAINNNLPEEALYKIYNFTLRANLNIKKLALYVYDDRWNCKVNFGTDADFHTHPFDDEFLVHDKITFLDGILLNNAFGEFDVLIPVAHKERKLACVFIGGEGLESGGSVNTNFVQALSNIIIVAIENKKLARRQLEQEMLNRELDFAQRVQQFLFPKDLPYASNIKAAAFYHPHHSIGGDYYDFIQINEDQFLFCIADVSGKGIPAALMMSNFQASLRTLVRQTPLLQEVVTELNYQLLSNGKGQHFITFFAGMYDRGRSRLKYVNAGHNPPVMLRQGVPELLESGTTILGVFDELPFLNVGIIENIDDFMICSFTDGLTEVANEKDEMFGSERVTEIVKSHQSLDPARLNDLIIDQMNSFKGASSYNDDVTLFTIQVSN